VKTGDGILFVLQICGDKRLVVDSTTKRRDKPARTIRFVPDFAVFSEDEKIPKQAHKFHCRCANAPPFQTARRNSPGASFGRKICSTLSPARAAQNKVAIGRIIEKRSRFFGAIGGWVGRTIQASVMVAVNVALPIAFVTLKK